MGIENSPQPTSAGDNQNQPAPDLEAQAENIINSHIADLEFNEDPLADDDDDQVIHYSTVIPKTNNNMDQEEIQVSRSILPAKRKKLLNLRYLTRLRGLVKVAQTLWALLLYIVIQFDYEYDTYPMQKITCHMCPFLIVFNTLIINAYVAFPHHSIRDTSTRNGMLFSELLTCMFFAIYFMICAPIRGVELILFKFDLSSLMITAVFQGPLTILILYDLFGCLGEWTLVGMRPLGQRPVPKNKSSESNSYTNQAFDFEVGKNTPQK
ncbi:hypothetical protein FO519_007707 [Halicephalobus sp. NKZ332]|nr:hypothetical protein FO519_007707 [Halicephalobus sp. NKZ332]